MKQLTNERGYTLLLTLVIAVLIVGFISLLLAGTLTQQTQVEKTDHNFVADDVAEMGMEYYRADILNKYVITAKEVKTAIQDAITTNPEKYVTATQVQQLEQEKEEAGINSLRGYIEAYTLSNHLVEKDKSEFQLYSVPKTSLASNAVQVKIELKGNYLEAVQLSTLSLLLPINLVNTNFNGGSGNGSGGNSYDQLFPTPDFQLPENISACDDAFSNSPCKIYDTKVNLSTIPDDTVVYFVGNLSANQTLMGLDGRNGTLYLLGNLDIQNSTNIENVNVFIQGESSYNHLEAKNAKFYYGDDLDFKIETTFTNSIIRIAGTAVQGSNSHGNKGIELDHSTLSFEGANNTISKITMNHNAKVCVANNTTIDVIDHSSGTIYVKEGVTFSPSTHLSKNYVQVLSDAEFTSTCIGTPSGGSTSVKTDINVNLENITNDVEYDIQTPE
ncbi:type II secretion system protein [Paenisporosarcina cavernae]|uniref:Type II secretion system protein n=1 Tax=Paenisporosarcina cavernae TaxID=2320858 RepID=A0A385YSH8_9BACL|nr:type II secretion system protein [Paenisporosarcina cavernae]AYC29759.1 type II secretion system protein [Paenisporosarcina cavernae]